MAKNSDLGFKKYCEKFIDFENELKKLFSTEEIKKYFDDCVGTMNCVSSVKQKKEMDEMLEWLKRKNREQDE
jgi:hypothetical protein